MKRPKKPLTLRTKKRRLAIELNKQLHNQHKSKIMNELEKNILTKFGKYEKRKKSFFGRLYNFFIDFFKWLRTFEKRIED
jgi:hypothetical protein